MAYMYTTPSGQKQTMVASLRLFEMAKSGQQHP